MYSMTGYGDARISCPYGSFRIEISSVNHKFRDTSMKVPAECRILESKIKKCIERKVRRGKITVFLGWQDKKFDVNMRVDRKLASEYLKAFRTIARQLHLRGEVEISFLANLPGVLRVKEGEIDGEKLWSFVEKGIDRACNSLLTMRKKEGEVIRRALDKSLATAETKLEGIQRRSDTVSRRYRRILEQRVRELVIGIDQSQFRSEIASIIQRMDIDEETTRLSGLLEQFSKTVRMKGDVGRKLDFLIQEMNRESNTIGAKSNDLNISRRVIDIKTELQKMREQVQNVE